MVALVKAEDVTVHFGPFEALKRVSIEVSQNEKICIIGPSGSGKTTFIRCLNQLQPVSSGRITINGELIGAREHDGVARRLSANAIARQRSQIGMVFQRFNLFPHFTALQNVIEGPIHVKKVPRDVAVAEALMLLDRVGLKDKADARPHQLSGGQQQRVAIARALAMKPLLLLFDEPTSALDHELIGEVLAVMRDLADEKRTMIIVTHELRFARDVADRIVFMDSGCVVEDAKTDSFFDAPTHGRARAFLSRLERA